MRRVPENGFWRWVAEHPGVGGIVSGVMVGVPFGLIFAVATDAWWDVPIAVALWCVLSSWRAYAMHRAIGGHGNSPYEAERP